MSVFVGRTDNSKLRKIMNYGYIRVSTEKQSVENQRYEIEQYFKAHSMEADGWIQETNSGTVYYQKRRLGRLLRKVKKGDVIVCTEISRLGRSLFMIMEILNLCMTKECVVCTIKEGYMLGNDISNKVLAFAFGLSAEIERMLISQRTTEALALRRAQGKTLGRPKGAKGKHNKLQGKELQLKELMDKSMPRTQIAKKLNVSSSTLYRFLKAQSEIKKPLENA